MARFHGCADDTYLAFEDTNAALGREAYAYLREKGAGDAAPPSDPAVVVPELPPPPAQASDVACGAGASGGPRATAGRRCAGCAGSKKN